MPAAPNASESAADVCEESSPWLSLVVSLSLSLSPSLSAYIYVCAPVEQGQVSIDAL